MPMPQSYHHQETYKKGSENAAGTCAIVRIFVKKWVPLNGPGCATVTMIPSDKSSRRIDYNPTYMYDETSREAK